MSDKPEWVKKLEAEPCTCVICTVCKGSGTIYFDLGGRFVGNHMTDDMDDPATCDSCNSGIVEECDRCMALEAYDMDAA